MQMILLFGGSKLGLAFLEQYWWQLVLVEFSAVYQGRLKMIVQISNSTFLYRKVRDSYIQVLDIGFPQQGLAHSTTNPSVSP